MQKRSQPIYSRSEMNALWAVIRAGFHDTYIDPPAKMQPYVEMWRVRTQSQKPLDSLLPAAIAAAIETGDVISVLKAMSDV